MQKENTEYIAERGLTAPKVVLLVDDDEDEHEIFLSALKNSSKQFHFVSADNCDKALEILQRLNPDYIFIDLNMPRTDGMICLQEIKKIQRIASVPVYMYSTGINEKEGKKALQLGAVDYIVKPNSLSTLCALLNRIIN